jgi:hypothetical protein
LSPMCASARDLLAVSFQLDGDPTRGLKGNAFGPSLG